MATRKIKFPVVLRQNDNSYSQDYGRYYPEAVPGETLSLSGLLAMVAFDQSVYTEDIVKGVVQAVTRSMVELLKEGQPVKWDGLGTFTPRVEEASATASATKDRLVIFKGSSAESAKILMEWRSVSAS